MQNFAEVIGRTVGMVGGRIRWFAGWNFRIQFPKQNYQIRWPSCPIRPRTTMEPFDAKGFYSKYQRRGSDKLISQSDHQQIKTDQTFRRSTYRLIVWSADRLMGLFQSDRLICWSSDLVISIWTSDVLVLGWSSDRLVISWSSDRMIGWLSSDHLLGCGTASSTTCVWPSYCHERVANCISHTAQFGTNACLNISTHLVFA